MAEFQFATGWRGIEVRTLQWEQVSSTIREILKLVSWVACPNRWQLFTANLNPDPDRHCGGAYKCSSTFRSFKLRRSRR